MNEAGIEVKRGDILTGSLACCQNKKNFRELDVKVSYHQCRDEKEIYKAVEQYKVR